jgi:cytochrome c oxidase assembly protein subunit 15
VALLSGLTQRLFQQGAEPSPFWWKPLAGLALAGVMAQCLLGARMATSWAAQRCLSEGDSCRWLFVHRSTATPVAAGVLLFVLIALLVGGWSRQQWPFLLGLTGLVAGQVALGVLTLRLGLAQPIVTVLHQLVAALLVALLAALFCRNPQSPPPTLPVVLDDSSLEPCHG